MLKSFFSKKLNYFVFCLYFNCLGPFLEKAITELDFSEDAMFRLSLLLSSFEDYHEELDPHTLNDENQAEMNMTFFLYIIKDMMEFNGFLKDKDDCVAARELRLALHKFDLLTQKT